MVNCLGRQVKPVGQFSVCQSFIDQAEDLNLPRRQSGRIGESRRATASWHNGQSSRAQIPTDLRGDGGRTEPVQYIESTAGQISITGVDERERTFVRS